MRLTGSRAYIRPTPVPKMPPGLVELMEEVTRDVLKNNPPDVYEFCAEHMRKLLEIRDGPSFKQPLTLEQKIARAQEKIRKREDARWQKYLKEKGKEMSKSKTTLENEGKMDDEIKNVKQSSPTVQPILKPPVYPDLNNENASEIEISHQAGEVPDLPIKTVQEIDTNSIEMDHKANTSENKDLSAKIEKAVNLVMPSSTKAKHTTIDNTKDNHNTNAILNDQHYDSVQEVISNPNENAADDDEVTAIKKQVEKYQIPTMETKCEKKENDDDLTDRLQNSDESKKDQIPTKETRCEEKENNEDLTDPPKNSDESKKDQILTKETKCGEKKNNEDLTDPPKNSDESNKNQISTMETKSEGKENNEDLADLPKNSDESNKDQFPTMEAKFEGKVNSESRSDPPKNPDESKKVEVVVEWDSEMLETAPIQGTPPDLKKYTDKLEAETKSNVNNSITEMGKLINTAVGVHNILRESSRSPSRIAKFTDDGNDDRKIVNDKNEDDSLPDVEKAYLPTKTLSPYVNESLLNTVIKENDDDNMKSLKSEKIECSSIESINNDNILDEMQQSIVSETSSIHAQNTQYNKSLIENNKEQPNITVVPVEEDSDKKIDKLNNSELDYTPQKMLEENIPSIGNHNLEPPIINVNDSIKDNSDNDKLSKEPLNSNSADAIAALTANSIQVHGEEPLANILDIHETRDTQEPNDGNIIEIRISQVAEALNNEVPLITEDDLKITEAELCLVPSTENKVNTQFINVVQNGDGTEEKNEAHLLKKSETVDDTPSTITLVDNTDEAHNTKTSDTVRSISIDESTDGLDNTSLIESGTSEATDDVIQHSLNNNSMDLETAAVTIQKVFRSFLFKSRASTFDDNEDNVSLDEDNEKKDELDFQGCNANLNKERRGISRMDTVLQTVNEEKSLSLSTDDSSTLSSAATTIQAHVRGFLLRNKLHSHKTASSNSLVNSDGPTTSLDGDVDHKNKTILNIHIVPEGGNYLSRDGSMLTSMELSLDGSPPSSLNLHPLGYDKNERRKQLKREDAIQSISPPSNNSGKLSEDVDSVKDMLITDGDLHTDQKGIKDDATKGEITHNHPGSGDTSPTNSLTIETVIETHKVVQESSDADLDTPVHADKTKGILTKQSSDEMDVVTPFEDKKSLTDSRSTSNLLHSGEFHDIVLPTKVTRNDASVVSEFKNVLVYFLLWNNS